MDFGFLFNAAIVGAIVSLAFASLALSFFDRLGPGSLLFVAVVAIGAAVWVLGDWSKLAALQIERDLPALGLVAAASLAGAAIGALPPLALAAIGRAMRGDTY